MLRPYRKQTYKILGAELSIRLRDKEALKVADTVLCARTLHFTPSGTTILLQSGIPYLGNVVWISPPCGRWIFRRIMLTQSSAESPGSRFDLSSFSGAGYDKGRSVLVQGLWLMTSSMVFQKWWCPGSVRVWILRAFGSSVGAGCVIRQRVRVHWPWKLSIGDDTWLGEGVWILNLEHVRIGSNTCVSQEVLLCTGSHDQRSATFEFDNGPVTIGNSVWLAARAVVLRGVTVHDGVTVGCSTVVSRDMDSIAGQFARSEEGLSR